MASPFKIFRKNAKVLLVGLFLMSMISFVIIPALLEYLGATRGSGTPDVVVTQRFGSLTEQQVAGLWSGQAAVQRFLEALQDHVSRRQGNPMQIVMFRQTLGELSEEQVVRLWLLARYAEAAGMTISDSAVNRYIEDLLGSTGIAISPQDLQGLMAQHRIDEDALFSGMNLALLAIRYAELSGVDPWRFLPGYAGETPGQRWDYFLRLRRMASVELAEIPVEKFAAKVAPPPDAQLRQLFEKYKTRLPQPNSPDPGFKVPEKVRFEYLKGDVTMWLERTSIPEEELRRVYEERKDELFLAPQTSAALPSAVTPAGPALPTPEITPPSTIAPQPGESAVPEAGDAGQAAPPASGAMQAPESVPTEQPAVENGEAGTPPEAESGKPESPEMPVPETVPEQSRGDAPSDTPEAAGDSMSAEAAPAREVPPEAPQSEAEQTPSGEKTGEGPAGSTESGSGEDAPSSSDQSRRENRPVIRLVGFAEENAAAPEGSPPAQPEASPAAPADAAVTQPAISAPAQPESSPPPSAAAPALPPAGENQGTAEKPKYRPFEEVRDEVRRIIAVEQMRAALDRIEEEMRRYQVAWGNYLSAAESAKESKAVPPEPPQRPNLEEIARREGFQYGRTELLPRWEVEALEIGKSTDSQGVPFSQVIFDLREFLTSRTFDVQQNQYLAWPTERVEEHVPEFTDPGVKEEVLQTWRLIEGRKLAEAECARLASEAEKSGKTLAEFCAGTEEFKDARIVPETEPFAWMTYGELDLAWAASRPPFLSSIKAKRKDPASGLVVDEDAVDQPGNEFMAAVFSLQAGEVGVAWNQPRSKVYLVRVIEMQPSPAQLYDAFVRQNQQTYISVSWYDRIEAYSRWSRNLEEEAGLRWNRAPARAARR